MNRRDLISGAAAGAALLARPALAQAWPTRPVNVIIPFAPGSITDTAARLIAEQLEKALGQPVIVDNRPGAGGLTAARSVARSTPDGYTLMITTNSTHSAAPGLFKNVPYDPIKDFTAIARIGSFPSAMSVNVATPVNSMKEFLDYAKANPGKLSYAFGNSTGQIAGEVLARRTGIDLPRVAYRSNPEALTALLGGQVTMMALDFSNVLPQLASKTLRPLAVLTKNRNVILPDVPTLNETVLPGFDLLAWAGVFGPANLPPEITARLSSAFGAMLADAEVKARFAKFGIALFYSDSAEFGDYVKSELVKWTTLIKEAGIEPE